MRPAKGGSREHVQRTLILLVEASSVAQADLAALQTMADAQAAQTRKSAAAEELQDATQAAAAAQEVGEDGFAAIPVAARAGVHCTARVI